MLKLLKGILNFQTNLTREGRAQYKKLAIGQKPDALFIGCSDSRVDPRIFASTDPGDVFVHRNVANLVPPYSDPKKDGDHGTAAVIEFAVLNLSVSDIIVCGHSECGGMQALLHKTDRTNKDSHLKEWLVHGASSLNRLTDQENQSLSRHNHLSQMNVLEQLDHLATYPFIQEKIQKQQLALHGWWFEIQSATVYVYDQKSKQFVEINQDILDQFVTKKGPSGQ